MEKVQRRKKEPNPRKTANALSLVLFGYVIPTFAKGYRKDLEEEDMAEHLADHDSKLLGDRLQKAWRKELTERKPSLWRAIRRVFLVEFLFLGVIYIFSEMILKLSQPLALYQLMKYYTQTDGAMSEKEAYLYSGLIVFTSFLGTLVGHNYMLSLQHFGMKMRVACCSLVYRKSLRLRKTVLGGTTIGQMVNLLSNDVNRCDRAIIHLHTLWLCPIETILIIFLLWYLVGVISTLGILFMVAFVPFQMFLGKKTSVYRLRTALKTDERIRLMNEIVAGIQVIKMYTWEKPFAKLVANVRRLEIVNVSVTSYIRGVMMSFVVFITRFSIFLTILTYVLLGNQPAAQYVFVVTSFYNILKQIMTKQFSRGITEIAEINVSISRLQNFLLYDETDTDQESRKTSLTMNGRVNKIDIINTENQKSEKLSMDVNKDGGVHLQNISAKWVSDSSDHTLQHIDLQAQRGELTAIIGPVGSGKTSLLHIILKELPFESGTLDIRGQISYASQEPWVFAGSIQQNILFGQPLNKVRYEEVIRVCALEQDLVLFPYGDKTLVGERGVMLSGGQRARVSLARAIYKEADIYLLDDPLSAVDTHVGKQLFENCISAYLKNKCIILVTHQLQYLRNADQIVLVENGKITVSGTYQEVQESEVLFAKQLNESADEESSGDSEMEIEMFKRVGKDEGKPKEVKEHRSTGTISGDIYFAYFKAGGSLLTALGIFIVFVLTQMSASGADYFLTFWVNLEEKELEENSTDEVLSRETCIYIYSSIVVAMIILTLLGTFSFYRYCMKASRRLHNDMFSNIVYATMKFFNLNSSGRILNRFAKDMGAIDEVLPTVAVDCLEIALSVIGVTVVVSLVKPWLLIVTVIIFIIFYFLRVLYLSTSRSVKRLEGITRSPVFGHMSASLQGLTTIRAYGAQGILEKEFDDLQDLHSSVWYLFLTCTRAFGFWLDLFCVAYIAAVTFSFFVSETDEYGGNVGLAITQAMSLTGRFQWGMRQWSELENHMTAVERVVEYKNIQREPERNGAVPSSWPEEGNIKFNSVSLKYSTSDPYVLKKLDFSIRPKEKIGIVGRTGAGKSSLIYALFQLTEIEGEIIIDNLDITKIPLHNLRSKISIIPQEPVLFSGTLRKNLDPFEEYSDSDLWNALEEVELKTVVADFPAGLNASMSEGGSNLSVGQRQLVCLARAIIRKNKILVLDEATANVDPQTDVLIQRTIRRKFADCTVLTIAHRLHTIMDSDKVLVMESGNAVEFDHPHLLLQNENSLFYSMVLQTGHAMAENLFKIAEDTYITKMEFK